MADLSLLVNLGIDIFLSINNFLFLIMRLEPIRVIIKNNYSAHFYKMPNQINAQDFLSLYAEHGEAYWVRVSRQVVLGCPKHGLLILQ
ncbi:hypothetical protein [Mucilaginibacter gynuensis]|uniref:hypothetical protein n=1 Tax=Mucilaginibacter gynuensis TaxID=1302236 RepID=UPI0031F014E4